MRVGGVVDGKRRTELNDGDVLAVGFFRQHRAHQARIGHEAIDVLMVLVGAHAVEAGLGGMQQFVERQIVVLADFSGVGDVEPNRVDEGGVVALLEIRRQFPIRHQVEHADFHGGASPSPSLPLPRARGRVGVGAACYIIYPDTLREKKKRKKKK